MGQNRARPTVLIGKDTRVSGYMLEAALESGFSAAGVDVMLAGPMPTPGIAYLTRALRLAAGVVISASHNPYYDNGIKFFSADGNKLPDEVESQIEEQLDLPLACAASEQLGKARRLDDAAGRYIEFCKSTFPAAFDLRGLKLVVDCAHGAAYDVAPHVFHELGAEVIPIGVAPNGFNINDGVRRDRAGRARARRACDITRISASRSMATPTVCRSWTAAGRLYNGDELLYVLVKDRVATDGKVEGAVGTLMTNMAVEVALQEAGVKFVRAAVGDRYVLEQAARARLATRRGRLGPYSVARPPFHGRRHRVRAAGARGDEAQRARRSPNLLDGVTPVPAEADQRADEAGRGLEGQRR